MWNISHLSPTFVCPCTWLPTNTELSFPLGFPATTGAALVLCTKNVWTKYGPLWQRKIPKMYEQNMAKKNTKNLWAKYGKERYQKSMNKTWPGKIPKLCEQNIV